LVFKYSNYDITSVNLIYEEVLTTLISQ
jgi:hypothetical protein